MQFKIERFLLLFATGLIVFGAPVAVLNRPADVLFVYQHHVFLLGLFLSIPLTLLVTLGLRWVGGANHGRLLWIKQPSAALRIEPTAPLAETAAAVRRRLAACGFSVEEHADSGGEVLLDFTKPKSPKIYSFIDHAFRGTVRLSPAGPRPEVAVTLTFDDIVLIETGEYAKLRALAGFLLGTEADFVVKQAPLTLVTGATLALANLAALILGLLRHAGWVAATFSVSFAAAALCAWGLAVVLMDRQHLEGLGLGALGLGAAGVPFLMLM